jgi:hypothetical protein
VLGRVAVDLAGRGEQEASARRPGEIERVLGPARADGERLERTGEVVRRARRAGEVQHRVDGTLDRDALDDVMHDELERVTQPLDVVERAARQVVDRDDVIALLE